jgi:hypothetical protein
VGCVCMRGVEASFYSHQGRFSPLLRKETLATGIRKSRCYSMSKGTWTGTRLGSAEPRVRPIPGGAPPGAPSFGWLAGGPRL